VSVFVFCSVRSCMTVVWTLIWSTWLKYRRIIIIIILIIKL